MKGWACQRGSNEDEHDTAMRNEEVFRTWKILPIEYELMVQRVKSLQSMIQHKKANAQIVAAIWGTLVVHDSEKCKTTRFHSFRNGNITDQAPIIAKMFQQAVECYRGVSGTETFFEEWEN